MWPALALFAIGVIQLREGAYEADLANHSDEPAHFVTALSLLDYVRTGLGTGPVAFAEAYYVQYPKVALGHWPPGFHILQALWYAVVGGTPASGLLLSGLISALAALVLVLRLRTLHGPWIAGLSVLVFLSLPVVRFATSAIMSDMLTGVFVLLALFAYADRSGANARTAVPRFTLWTTLAILTKASAVILLPFALAGQMVVRRTTTASLSRRQAWAVGGVLVLTTLVVLGLAHITGLRSLPSFGELPALRDRVNFLGSFLRIAPPAMLAVAAFGVVAAFSRSAAPGGAAHARLASLLLALWLISQVAVRDVIEDRYFLPAVFPLVVLFSAGCEWLARATTTSLARYLPAATSRHTARAVTASLAALCITWAPSAASSRRDGYAGIVRHSTEPVVLVSSDPIGEGAVIAEALVRDAGRQQVVLRASKLLASSDWMGTSYELRTPSVAEVRTLLDTIPVHVVILDGHGFIDERSRPHHRLLERTLREHPEQFRLLDSSEIHVSPSNLRVPAQVYLNLAAEHQPAVVRVPMGPPIGRTFELQTHDRSRVPRRNGASYERDAWVGDRIAQTARWLGTWLPRRPPPAAPLRIRSSGDTADGAGGPGQILVTAGAYHTWAVTANVPWITLASPSTGAGSAVVQYVVAPNDGAGLREGDLTIGGARYHIRQPEAPFIQPPFVDTFDAPLTRWQLETHSGRATIRLAREGPERTGALVLFKPGVDADSSNTQVYLPAIDTEAGASYDVSVRLRAEGIAEAWLSFEQRYAPYGPCGLWQPVALSSEWTTVTARFTAEGPGCGHDMNRLTIVAGNVSGRLWIADVSLRRVND